MARITPIPVTLRDGRGVTLRAAEAGDVKALCALTASVTHENGYTLFVPEELGASALRAAKRIPAALDDPNDLRLIAVTDQSPADAGRVVGDLTISAGKWVRLAHCATIGIDIHRGFRRVGLGDAMLRAALAWATAHPRVERVELYCYADNAPAIALYRKHGFVEEGRRERYFRLGEGRYADDLVMARFVKTCATESVPQADPLL
jgi:RimJ/RimL family protein N-acetyltransferase